MKKSLIIGVVAVVLILAAGAGFWKWNSLKKAEIVKQNKQSTDAKKNKVEQKSLTEERVDEIIEKSKHVAKLGDIPEGVSEEDYYIAFRTKIHQLNNMADGKTIPWRGSFGYNDGNKFFNEPPYPDVPEGKPMISIQDFNGDSVLNFSPKRVEVRLNSKSICVYPKTPDHPRFEFPCLKAGRDGNPLLPGGAAQIYGSQAEDGIIALKKMVVYYTGDLVTSLMLENLQ